MNAPVCMIFHDGMEELEAIAPLDILRRANLTVDTFSVSADTTVTSRNGIRITADKLFPTQFSCEAYGALVIPGGPGVHVLRKMKQIGQIIRDFHKAGKWIGTLCAGPLLLHDQELLSGIRYAAHASTSETLSAIDPELPVVVAGRIVTSRGAGTAIDFGLTLLACFCGESAASTVAKSMEYPHW